MKLKELRIAKSLTQAELSKQLKISPSTIGMYEQGRREPDIDTLKKIAIFFDVSTDYLLGNTIDKKGTSSSLPPITDKDERNIQKKLQNVIEGLDSDSGIAYFNDEEPMSEEDKELLRISLENTLRLARQMAKQKFNPKKYRQE